MLCQARTATHRQLIAVHHNRAWAAALTVHLVAGDLSTVHNELTFWVPACLSVCLCLQRRRPSTGWGHIGTMNPLALLPREAMQTDWLGKACGVESQRGWGRAQRAGGERRAPGNMLAEPAARGGGGAASVADLGQPATRHRRPYKQRSPPRHSSCRSVQTGRLGSRKGQGRCKGAGTGRGRGTQEGCSSTAKRLGASGPFGFLSQLVWLLRLA